MNKAASLQLEHFNKSNALSWALTMGLFAIPVVYSDREWNQMVGESYYIQLGPDDRFGWTEPEGKVYQIARRQPRQLKDEIYRVCYLMIQAISGGAGKTAVGAEQAAGLQTTEEVLRAYGDPVKESMKQVLWAIAAARQDGIGSTFRGWTSSTSGISARIGGRAEAALAWGSIRRRSEQMFKKLALK